MEVETVELGLNYMEDMTCLHLYQPEMRTVPTTERGAFLRQMLSRWIDVVRSTKTAHMQVENAESWPHPDFQPWTIQKLDDMLVAVWFRQQF